MVCEGYLFYFILREDKKLSFPLSLFSSWDATEYLVWKIPIWVYWVYHATMFNIFWK